MPVLSIKNMINRVLGEKDTNRYYYNPHRTFTFKDGYFYSYREQIAKVEDNVDRVHIFPKTAILGQFYSYTTSKHVNYIISFCKQSDIQTNLDKDKIELNEIELEEECECPISMEMMKKGVKLKCGHIFNKLNIETWLKHHKNCPLCRSYDIY